MTTVPLPGSEFRLNSSIRRFTPDKPMPSVPVEDSPSRMAANAPTYLEPEASPSSMACPQCGKLRLPGQNYCKGCGAKLSD